MAAAEASKKPPKQRARTRPTATPAPRRATVNSRAKQPSTGRRWLGIIAFFAIATMIALSVFSFDAADGAARDAGQPVSNWIGPVGHAIARAIFHAIGVSAWGAAFALLTLAVLACSPRGIRLAPLATFGWVLVGTATSALAHLLADASTWSYPPGGALGSAVAGTAQGAFSFTGSFILLLALFLMAMLLATHFAMARAFEYAARGVGRASITTFRAAWAAWQRSRRARAMRRELEEEEELIEAGEDARYPITLEAEYADEEEEDEEEKLPPPPPRSRRNARLPASPPPAAAQTPAPLAPPPSRKQQRRPEEEPKFETDSFGRISPDALTEEPRIVLPNVPPDSGASSHAASTSTSTSTASSNTDENDSAPTPKPRPRRASKVAEVPASVTTEAGDLEDEQEAATTIPEPPIVIPPAPARTQSPAVAQAPASAASATSSVESSPAAPPSSPTPVEETATTKTPTIIEPRPPPKPSKPLKQEQFTFAHGTTGFHTPASEDILEGESTSSRQIDRAQLTATAERLRQKLIDLGVGGEVTEIRPGPVVTMYEFRPDAGIKLSRIASLSDDLAMAMEALRVRIVAPIPGKGVVGFEVPNRTRETVFLKEVVEQDAFQKGASKLTMAIGKDIEGMPYVSDLAKMPHLLIAGTTGSGKSVGVNSMLVSMLMRATPEELRFIMVDPKMLELSIYEGIPHLLLPVVTDPKKAALALRWGVEEMERRYQLLADAGVRNISQYNKIVDKELAEAKPPPEPVQLELGEDDDPLDMTFEEPPPEKKRLPFIVIVIDELADLMMVAAKEVEVYIARLAQMARAAGIHLMVATQRPSTDVLTGVIKANFPTRISFQVASRHDSATIINTPGAENLLGMGDMLILPPGTSSLTRVHGAYVSEAEINRLTAFWKAQGAPVYDPEILKPRDEGGEGFEEDEVADALYDQAIAAVSDMRQVSISLLQRKMRIGYNRAARMIERMERDGIVGPADGAKPRDVLIRPLGEMPGA